MSQSKSTTIKAMKFILCVAFLLAFANVTLAQTPTPTPAPAARRANARPFPPPQYIPAHDYDQRNIKLEFRFDWEKEQALGIETITLAPTVRDLKRVEFDAAFMTVASAKLAKGTPLKFDYDGTKEKLTVMLDRAYQPNEEITIVISYHTNRPPAERIALIGGGGLNFILPRPDDPTRPKQVWSQGEAEANHFWFP